MEVSVRSVCADGKDARSIGDFIASVSRSPAAEGLKQTGNGGGMAYLI